MTLAGLSPAGALIVRAGEPFALQVGYVDDAGDLMDLTGRTFALAIRYTDQTQPIVTIDAELDSQALTAVAIGSGAQASQIHAAGASRRLSYDFMELTGGAVSSRLTERVAVEAGSEIPGNGVPQYMEVSNLQILVNAQRKIVTERGRPGFGAERRLFDAGLIDAPTVEKMDQRYRSVGEESALELKGDLADEGGELINLDMAKDFSPGKIGWLTTMLGRVGYPVLSASDLSTIEIPATVSELMVGGYAALGDGGGATWKRAVSEPSHSAKRQDAAGAWFELAEPIISVEMFGAVAGLGLSAGQQIANAAAFNAAIAYLAVRGGGEFLALGQFYLLRGRIDWQSGVFMRGAGIDEWSPIYPANPKVWKGTNLLFCGAGVRDQSYYGITSMRYAGGWRENPDSAGSYYKLTSFRNADANGGTASSARLVSVGINMRGIQGGGISNCRIVTADDNDGIDGHSNTSWASLGADWDIGLALVDSQNVKIDNVQPIGYWRDAGFAEIQTAITESMGERNHVRGMVAQGRVGFLSRGMDRWAVIAATADTISLRWSEEHYWPATGTLRAYNGTSTATYSYTSLARVGDNLVFSGVTPDCSTVSQVRHGGRGVAGTVMRDVLTYSLNHVGGAAASSFGLADSKPVEISGYPKRGLRLHNFKAHTDEAVVAHIHDCADLTFIDPQFEGPGHMIATPVNTDMTWAAAPIGETRNIMMLGDTGTDEMDLRLFTPRSGRVDSIQWAPRDQLVADTIMRAMRSGKHLILRMREGGGEIRLQSSDGSTNFQRISASGSTIFQGNTLPQADNSFANGSASSRYKESYVVLRKWSPTCLDAFGAGSPEGVLTASIGSTYRRTDGGAGTSFYVKQSGAGNTGWVAK